MEEFGAGVYPFFQPSMLPFTQPQGDPDGFTEEATQTEDQQAQAAQAPQGHASQEAQPLGFAKPLMYRLRELARPVWVALAGVIVLALGCASGKTGGSSAASPTTAKGRD